MKLIDQYIMKSVLATLMLALLVLAGLDTLFSFIAELEDLRPTYGLPNAALYSLATFPRRTYEFIPIATLIGCLLSLGMLSNNSELIVMRAAGVSVKRIVFAAIKAVLIVIVCGLILGQWVMPKAERFAQSYRALKLGGGTALKVNQGNWHRDGEDFVHINTIAPNGVMFGVTRYRVNHQNQLVETSYSSRADYQELQEPASSGLWSLQQVRGTSIGADRVSVAQFDEKKWQTSLDPKLINLVVLKPDYLSISGLHQYAVHMQAEGMSYKPYSLAFWKKILQPLATITMIIIAVSFIFGPLRSVTMGFRVMVGLIIGLLFNYTQDFLGYSSLVFDVQPWVAASVPVACFAVIGAILISRVH